jgi:hypothetical protein
MPVLKTISPILVVENPNPIPSKTVPSERISFPFLSACFDFFTEIVTLHMSP